MSHQSEHYTFALPYGKFIMAGKDIQTEIHIKETAKTIFFKEGRFNATTQEIANEAGVNRALIHYYFRSRDLLFEAVLKDGIDMMHVKIQSIMTTDISFREKLSRFIDLVTQEALDFPYLETFIITALNEKEQSLILNSFDKIKTEVVDIFAPKVEAEIALGTIAPITATQFMINLLSLCTYPVVSKALIQKVFGLNEEAFRQLMLERKEIILNTLLKKKTVE